MVRVSDERRAPNAYRWGRQVSALLLIAVVVVIVVLDVIVEDYRATRAPQGHEPTRRDGGGRLAHGSVPVGFASATPAPAAGPR
jgi:hypothetical protein